VAKKERRKGPEKTNPLQWASSTGSVTPRERIKKGRKGTTRFMPTIARNWVAQRIYRFLRQGSIGCRGVLIALIYPKGEGIATSSPVFIDCEFTNRYIAPQQSGRR
jgi:hypothetical protein